MTGSDAEISRAKVLVLLAGLAILAYLPVFVQPFVADDYVQINVARRYGPVSGWPALAADALYRSRATSLILTYWTERFLGFEPLGFYSTGVLLHIINTFLVFALGAWRVVGWRASAVAAAFFAVHEGHQEAVMWYAALPELLMFVGALACVVYWIRWVQSEGARPAYYAAALGCFLFALASKESAVGVVPLLLLPLSSERISWRRGAAWLAPFAALALAHTWVIFASRVANMHFRDDGTFSLDAPVWITWSNSYWRLLWIWGVLSLAAMLAWRARERWSLVRKAIVWIAISLLPYCFLLYMTRIPSRHTYLASAGLALVVAAGVLTLHERLGAQRRWATAAVVAAILVHNVGYLWVKKRSQFLERAEPTEALIALVRQVDGPVYMHCFTYGYEIAQLAVEMKAGKPATILQWRRPAEAEQAAVFCFGLRKRCSQVKPDPRLMALRGQSQQ